MTADLLSLFSVDNSSGGVLWLRVKKQKKERLQQIKEQFRAVRAGLRKDEMEDHNGKPFTSKNLPRVKTKYYRKADKNKRDEY